MGRDSGRKNDGNKRIFERGSRSEIAPKRKKSFYQNPSETATSLDRENQKNTLKNKGFLNPIPTVGKNENAQAALANFAEFPGCDRLAASEKKWAGFLALFFWVSRGFVA